MSTSLLVLPETSCDAEQTPEIVLSRPEMVEGLFPSLHNGQVHVEAACHLRLHHKQPALFEPAPPAQFVLLLADALVVKCDDGSQECRAAAPLPQLPLRLSRNLLSLLVEDPSIGAKDAVYPFPFFHEEGQSLAHLGRVLRLAGVPLGPWQAPADL